jgi:isoleucyl-tRNA synthetase
VTLARLIAPVLSHLAEDVWQHVPEASRGATDTIFLTDWPKAKPEWQDAALKERWERIAVWRDVAMKALEGARQAKRIGASLEARVTLYPISDDLRAHLAALDPKAMAKLLIVSQAEVAPVGAARPEGLATEGDLAIHVDAAHGTKCQRCWVYTPWVGTSKEHPTLCERCCSVV